MHLMKKPAILLIAILASVLFVFATAKKTSVTKKTETASAVNSVATTANTSKNADALFSELHLGEAGLSQNVFNSALTGLEKLDAKGDIKKDDIITIIDFSQPSNKKRLYVVDLDNKQVLFNTLVAHGRKSGGLWAKSFSNQESS